VVDACNPSYSGGRGRKIMILRPSWQKLVRPYHKNEIKTKSGIQHLPSSHEALSLIPSTTKEKKKYQAHSLYFSNKVKAYITFYLGSARTCRFHGAQRSTRRCCMYSIFIILK
jgi:hypothetical protein